ncbi:uncharacterized protein LOC126991056 [Eriocheir sinensis]|uniref:uncharacterized protein LOC126991056 n=1 Tax=Eriocheir sinensis TaxID=95602 RepID=UPI0021C92856|nr:uncharacterized protein LOC126991056 [Eriocheir sinensis]
MVFNVEEFVGNPSVEELKTATVTVEQLKYIATNYNIPFTSQTRKPELMSLILAHLGDPEEEADHLMESPTSLGSANLAIALEIERVKMQALQMKLEYEKEARALEREEKALEREEKALEREEKALEREEKALEREHQLSVLQLQSSDRGTRTPNRLQITKFLPLMPQFSDYDPEAFFREFESSAIHFDLPKEDWPWLVKPKLNGKALAVLDNIEDNSDYEVVKSAILAAYAVTTERYRQTFRNMNKTSGQTYLEFASEKLRALRHWLKSAAVTTYDDLVNLVALEEFKRKIPYSIMLHITDKDETEFLKAAKLADVFSLIHRSMPSGDKKLQPVGKSGASYSKDVKPAESSGTAKSFLSCSFCKKVGHLIKNCPDPRCKVARTSTFSKPVASLNTPSVLPPTDPFQPFRSQGTVALNTDSEGHPLQIMRDTASAQSIILKSALPGIEQQYTGEKVLIKIFIKPFPYLWLGCT